MEFKPINKDQSKLSWFVNLMRRFGFDRDNTLKDESTVYSFILILESQTHPNAIDIDQRFKSVDYNGFLILIDMLFYLIIIENDNIE